MICAFMFSTAQEQLIILEKCCSMFTHMADGGDNFSKGVSNLRTSVAMIFFVKLGEFLQANTITSSFAFQNILQVF